MYGSRSLFSDLDKSFKDNVKLGNNFSISIIGKGIVRLQVKGRTFKFSRVFYVLELKSNLIGMGQLQERDYTIVIKKGCCSIQHLEKGIIAQIVMTPNRLFPLHN